MCPVSRFAPLLTVAIIGVTAIQAGADERALAGRPRLAIPRLAQPPVIDGRLDDEVWLKAAHVDGLTQQLPNDGQPASERTQFWLGYDSQHFYFAARAHYKDPSTMRVNRAQRDRHLRDDRVSLYLDTFIDQQRAYKFTLNGYGVQGDAIFRVSGGGGGGPGGGPEDMTWDALYASAGVLVEDGWTVEVAIPFKSIRYPDRKPGEEHRWGLQLHRSIEAIDEDDTWSPVSRDVPGFLNQMGVAHGIRDLSTSRNLELLPAVTAARATTLDGSTGEVSRDVAPDAGFSLKYGLSSNLTLDATVNPDFSQIEADRPQITVNNRFPIQYDERRPFFLEGQDIFGMGLSLVHTRTIVDPRYGAKITGKLGKANLGLLVADDEAAGRFSDTTHPLTGSSAQIAIGRVRYDYASESHVGVLVTDREFGPSFNRVAAADGRIKLSATDRFSFIVVGSADADEHGSRKNGYAAQVNYNHSSRHVNWGLGAIDFSPGFETDLGFFRRVDIREGQANASVSFYPLSWVQTVTPRARYERTWDHAGSVTDNQVEVGLNLRFARNINARVQMNQDMERFGGIDFDKRRYSMGGDANFSRRFSFGGNVNWGDSIRYVSAPFLGRSLGYSLNGGFRPTSRLESGVGVNRSRFVDPATGAEVFDVTTYRANAQYQFTDRLQVRNIFEYDSFAGKLGVNVLVTYRVNSGTVAYFGVDDRRQEEVNINPALYQTDAFRLTGRTVFFKLAYLFRY